MNRIFKTMWSYTLNRPVVTDELHSAKRGKKSGKTATAAVLSATALLLAAGSPLSAAETEDSWIVISNPEIRGGFTVTAEDDKTEYRFDSDMIVDSHRDAAVRVDADVKFTAGNRVSIESENSSGTTALQVSGNLEIVSLGNAAESGMQIQARADISN